MKENKDIDYTPLIEEYGEEFIMNRLKELNIEEYRNLKIKEILDEKKMPL